MAKKVKSTPSLLPVRDIPVRVDHIFIQNKVYLGCIMDTFYHAHTAAYDNHPLDTLYLLYISSSLRNTNIQTIQIIPVYFTLNILDLITTSICTLYNTLYACIAWPIDNTHHFSCASMYTCKCTSTCSAHQHECITIEGIGAHAFCASQLSAHDPLLGLPLIVWGFSPGNTHRASNIISMNASEVHWIQSMMQACCESRACIECNLINSFAHIFFIIVMPKVHLYTVFTVHICLLKPKENINEHKWMPSCTCLHCITLSEGQWNSPSMLPDAGHQPPPPPQKKREEITT